MQAYWNLVRRRPHFRSLWLAELISLLGDWFNTIAAVMLVNRYAGSSLAVGALFLARALPPFLAGPFAGVVADRFNRKTVMITADVLRAVIVLGFLLVDRPERLWLIYALSTVQFVVSAFFEPARAALVPALVAEDELVAANTLSSVTWSAMLALGAAIGGLTAALLGPQLAMVVDASSFVASALLVAPIAAPARAGLHVRVSGWDDFLAGLRYAWARPPVGWAVLIKGLGQTGSVDVMAAAFAVHVFPLGPEGATTLGLTLAANGLGAILGPIVGNRFHDQSVRQLQRAILGGYALNVVSWIVLGVTPALPLLLAAFLLRGMGGSLNWTYSDVLLQLQVEDQFRGRVFSLNLAFFTLMLSGSVWLNSLWLDHWSPRGVAGGLAAVSVLPFVAWLAVLWSLRPARTPARA